MNAKHQKRVDQVNSFAIYEGWFVANGDEIQADDSDDIGRGFKFADDESAREHVKRLAGAGSALHREVLTWASA